LGKEGGNISQSNDAKPSKKRISVGAIKDS
jgi:hypothetical protein